MLSLRKLVENAHRREIQGQVPGQVPSDSGDPKIMKLKDLLIFAHGNEIARDNCQQARKDYIRGLRRVLRMPTYHINSYKP